jgi:hypothetical protein
VSCIRLMTFGNVTGVGERGAAENTGPKGEAGECCMKSSFICCEPTFSLIKSRRSEGHVVRMGKL